MEPKFYEIDPNGDTLLILHNADAPFAVLPSSTPQEEESKSDSTPDDKAADKPQDAETKPIVRMRLSSKHLSLASKYFQKLTANNWKETTPEDGYSYTINTNDWDQEALLVVMNIIHGRTAKVPRFVGLEMLAKIAVLVDYYQCHEAVEFFAKTWIMPLPVFIDQKEGDRRDLMLRAVVFLVFSENIKFWLLAKMIIQTSTEAIDSLGLPIRQDIIDTMNSTREDAISFLVAGLRALRIRLCQDQSCAFECSSIYLGALIKAMTKMHLIDPLPTRPYPGLSLLTLEQGIRDIREPIWATNCHGTSASPSTNIKPAAGQSSNLSGGTPSSTQNPPTQAATTASFKFSTPPDLTSVESLSQGRSPSPEPSLSGSSLTGSPRTKPSANSSTLPTRPVHNFAAKTKPVCNLAAKTKPIIDELLRKISALEFKDLPMR